MAMGESPQTSTPPFMVKWGYASISKKLVKILSPPRPPSQPLPLNKVACNLDTPIYVYFFGMRLMYTDGSRRDMKLTYIILYFIL
jgi:hypothetical protein